MQTLPRALPDSQYCLTATEFQRSKRLHKGQYQTYTRFWTWGTSLKRCKMMQALLDVLLNSQGGQMHDQAWYKRSNETCRRLCCREQPCEVWTVIQAFIRCWNRWMDKHTDRPWFKIPLFQLSGGHWTIKIFPKPIAIQCMTNLGFLSSSLLSLLGMSMPRNN